MASKIKVEVAMRKQSERAGQDGFGVKGEDGEWYHFINVDSLDFTQGATVELTRVKRSGKTTIVSEWNVVKSTRNSGGGSAPAPASRGGFKAGPNNDYSEVNWNAATARAIEATELLLKHDAVALGAKTAKPNDRKLVIMSVVGELTAHFFKEIKARTALKDAAAIAEDLDEEETADEDDGDADDGDF